MNDVPTQDGFPWDNFVNEMKIDVGDRKSLSLSEFAQLCQVAALILGEDAVVVNEYGSVRGSYMFQRKGWREECDRRIDEWNIQQRLKKEQEKGA
jgi:hypothetical protein